MVDVLKGKAVLVLIVLALLCAPAPAPQYLMPSKEASIFDNESDFQVLAAECLVKINDVRAVEPLILALKDKDNRVRSTVAGALGYIKDTRAIEPLIQILGDSDKDVRSTAKEALIKLGWKQSSAQDNSSSSIGSI